MLQLSIVYAESDAAMARQFGAHLERNCRVEVDYGSIVTADRPLLDVVGSALGADALVLLVSEHLAPRRFDRKEWEPILVEEAGRHGTHMVYVTIGESRFPKVLLRNGAIDASGGVTECARALKRWVHGLRPAADRPSTVPAGPAAADPQTIETLRRSIADAPGAIAVTGAAVARAFIDAAGADFEAVLWVDGQDATPACVAGDLGAQLGLRLAGELSANLDSIRRVADEYRCLVVFEGVRPEVEAEFRDLGFSSTMFLPAVPAPAPSAESVRRELEALAGWVNTPDTAFHSARIHRSLDWLVRQPAQGSLPCDFARAAVAYYKFHDRFAEAFEVVEMMSKYAIERHDRDAANEFGRERGWILESWGRPDGAVHPFAAAPETAVQLALW